jgi:hypothetical protein
LSATNSFTVVVNDLNFPPVLPTQTNLTLVGLASLVVTNTATNADIHAVSLNYQLMIAPTNAVIDTNGVITWTPVLAQVPGTNLFVTVATDYDPLAVNAASLSATNSFTVTVSPPLAIQSINVQNGTAAITWSAVAGQAYMLQYQTSLDGVDWSDLPPPVIANGPIAAVTNAFGGSSQGFFRVVLLP